MASSASVLSRRDVEVLAFVGEQYGLRLDQLGVLLARGERTPQRVVARLRQAGLVEARPLLAGEPGWLWLTAAGRRASGRPFPGWAPRLGLLTHIEAVTWVRLYVRSRSSESGWVCERTLLKDRVRQADHVPDGVVLTPAGESHAIEVELTVKSRARTERIIDELSAAHDAVVYFTTPATRSSIERLGGTGRWPRLAIRDYHESVAAVRR
ncbi:MAG TPA: hypothetical protein VGG41_12900 [Solirubrobacteraceae bacterium]|jgi:hypothetical protein